MFYGLPRSEEGLAIFSKHPILETEYILLSRDQDDSGSHQRICLWALIQTPNGPIQFFVTHLELVLAMSASNAQDIVSYADQKLEELNTPQILVGDMNAESDSETIQILSKSFHDAFISAGSPKEHELTFQTQGNYQKRIDFCFHRKWKLNVTDFKVIDQVMNGTHASDHYGVQVTFEK
jgi:maltose 6'-phosphate phosphatase